MMAYREVHNFRPLGIVILNEDGDYGCLVHVFGFS